MEFARDSFKLGNIWREVYPELKLEELWMQNKRVKKGKKNPQDKYYEASERISCRIINENAHQGKCHGKTIRHRQVTG